MAASIRSYIVGIMACSYAVASFACIDTMSKYYAGAILNADSCNYGYYGADVDFSQLEAMGTEGLNYFRVCDSTMRIGDSLSFHADSLPETLRLDRVSDVKVRIQWNMMTISLSHSGCCRGHLFGLHTTGLMTTSQPPELNFVLSHDARGDICDAGATRDLTFDLSSLLSSVQGKLTVRISLKLPGDTTIHSYNWTPTPYFTCSYSYRSHFVDNAMVFLGYFTPEYQNRQPYPRIAVYFDTTKTPTAEQKANAVAEELRWLTGQGILTWYMPDSKIARIQTALTADPEQYWMLQDTVLPYNMWFQGTGIGGVRAVNGVKGGCGLGASYTLPSEPLGPSAAVCNGKKSEDHQSVRVINNRERTILRLPYPLEANTSVKVYNLSGELIGLIKAVSGSRSIEWDRRGLSGQRVGPGHYIFAWEGVSLHTCRLLVGP